MSQQRDVRHGLRIGRAEFVRSVREYFRDRRRIIGLGFVLLVFGGNTLFALPIVYGAGRAARSVTSIPYFGFVATALPVVLLLLASLRTAERIGNVDAEELILMTVHPRAAVIGLISSEIALLALWIGLPLGAVVTVFALGMGAPTLPVTVGLVFLPLLCWAAVWGYAFGIGVLRLLRWLPGLQRILKIGWAFVLIPLMFGAPFIGTSIADGSLSMGGLLAALTFEPLQSYAELAFVGTELFHTPSIGAVAVLGILVVLTPVGLAVATGQATALWFTDDPTPAQPQRAEGSSDGFETPQPLASTGAGAIAWGHLLRAVRQPQELAHLTMILFMLGPGAAPFLQSAENVGPIIAGIGVVLATYLAGATFGLNPLGDDRPAFPLLLLAEVGPRTLVRSRVIAGLAIGTPIAVVVPLGSIVAGTLPLPAIGFAVVGCGMCLTAATFAVGIGSAYPIYEEREFWGTETVVPSTGVMMVYLFIVGGGTAIGLFLTWSALTGSLGLSLPVAIGVGVYLLLTATIPYGSYRYAVRRYRTYTVQ